MQSNKFSASLRRLRKYWEQGKCFPHKLNKSDIYYRCLQSVKRSKKQEKIVTDALKVISVQNPRAKAKLDYIQGNFTHQRSMFH